MAASPSTPQRAIEVFFSYAHEDEALRDELAKHLRLLERQAIIAGWHDRQITAGREWAGALDAHLQTARIILLLVSADFLASDYCYDIEMQQAMVRHEAGEARVIPIILRPVDWHSAPFGRLQALPKNGRAVTNWQTHDDAFLDIARGIRAVAEEIAQPTDRALPSNLPPPYGEFLGRENDVARVLEGLQSRWPLISIDGLPGIGKTTLAIEMARRCLAGANAIIDPPFEAAVWISAADRPEQKQWLNEVLDSVARVIGYRYVIQVPPEQKSMEIDHLLRHHRTLVIVDNFESIEDPNLLEWIQRVPEVSKAVITTRHHRLERVWEVHLKGLEEQEALGLIRRQARRLGLQMIETAADDILLPLFRITEGTPRIIEMALGHVKGGRLSLNEVTDHLRTASKTVDDVFKYLFARDWESMTTDAQSILLVTPFFADLVSKEALGAASGLTGYRLDNALQQLVELALLDINEESVVSSQRYSTHPLTRAFAHTKLQEVPEYEEQARIRWSAYFVNFAAQNLIRENTKEGYWNVLTKRGNKEIDLEWLNFQQVFRWVDRQEHDSTLIKLMTLLVHYMYRRILYSDRIDYARKAANAAHKLNRKEEEALLRIDALGWLLIEEGRFAEAQKELKTGLEIAQAIQTENPPSANDLIALATTFLARLYLEQGDIDTASELINQALSIPCKQIVECRVYMIAGDVAGKKNKHKEALGFYEHAMRITQEEEDVDFDARLHYCLGSAYLGNGDLARAESEFSRVLDIEQQAINIVVMYAKYGLARVAQAKGNKEEARYLAQSVFEELSRSIASHQLLSQIDNLLKSLETI